jgi:alpha-1,6-mannosyltransferase
MSGQPVTSPRAAFLLYLTGFFLLGSAVLVGQDTGTVSQWVGTIMVASVLGGFMVLLTVWTWRNARPGKRWLLFVILAGLGMRLAVMPAGRELSDDAARYHWDGKVLAHGINPFLHAPDNPAVAHLKTQAIDDRINHPWNRTCYPPLAQAVFTAGYLMSPGRLIGLQILFLVAELATWLLLARELSRRKKSAVWLLPAIWGPLIFFQGYLPGHLDLLNLPLVTLFILAVMKKQAGRAGLYLALACLVKPLPLLFMPAAIRELGPRGSMKLGLGLAGVLAVAYLPFLGAGRDLFGSTWLMATDWSFNGSLGALLEVVFPQRQAHLLSGLMTGLLVMAGAWRGRDFLSRALLAQTAFIAFTFTLFPWYLIGMIPLLVLRPDPSLLTLCCLAPVSDQVVIGHQLHRTWQPAWWTRPVQYVPFFGLLLAGWRKRWGMFRPVGKSGSTPAI